MLVLQALVEKLEKEGHSKHDLGREKFINQVWKWKNQYGDIIINQLKKLGCSCDYRETLSRWMKIYQNPLLKYLLIFTKKADL